MAKWVIRWKKTPVFMSLPVAEIMKVTQTQLMMIKTDMDAGLIKDWGAKADNSEGYAVMEGTETQIYEDLLKYQPYISFEASPVMTLTQYSEGMMKLVAMIGK